MSTSLLAFLTLVENQARTLLPAGKAWRFQRIVNFRDQNAVLQLWDDSAETGNAALSGQLDLRESRPDPAAPSAFSGTVRISSHPGGGRNFAFHAGSDAEIQTQARSIAELWRQALEAQ